MSYLLVHHKVTDFDKWEPVYNMHVGMRNEALLEETLLLRNSENSNEVFILFKIGDIEKAQQFIRSEDLRQVMQRAGVRESKFYFLEEAKVIAPQV